MKLVRIQDSFLDVISDVESGRVNHEDVWAEIIDGKTKPSKFRVYKDKLEPLSPGLTLRKLDHWKYQLSDEESTLKCVFPVEKYDFISHKLTSVNVTAKCNFVVGDRNGRLLYGKLGSKRDELKEVMAHDGGIVKVLYFPSDKVLLSAGLDMMLKIWDCIDYGLQSGWEGPNFVTSSLDAQLKLWECSSGMSVASMDCLCGITAVKIHEDRSQANSVVNTRIENLFEVEGKIAICGLENGDVKFWRIADQALIKHLDTSNKTAVTDLAIAGDAAYVGYSNGKLLEIGLTDFKIKELVDVAERIDNVKVIGSYIVISFGFGNLVGYNIKDTESPIYFTGLENDVPVADICIQNKSIYAVGKYGLFQEFLL
ncbi:26S proteasome regulatory subunit [Komagataella phaffii CBS 7435]|uniref:26S proteasome regulatory subunit n=1 Tax=Komagataella phaffii (strain ATCC 76273 / CBS 7435 / CECT 11047 / NRRL Y-11430 / Wegner 21-1) TaxID=981350 RepID=F2QMC5_KOMPC|nr:26S proteasome regulatory subunit [Komagataella phaffii CBS 7435]CCA36572.1 26S proteasome regulatory subunit [Komagataella phaffii CBS 7435]